MTFNVHFIKKSLHHTTFEYKELNLLLLFIQLVCQQLQVTSLLHMHTTFFQLQLLIFISTQRLLFNALPQHMTASGHVKIIIELE